MAMKHVLALSASPSPNSKTARLVDDLLEHLQSDTCDVRHIRLCQLDAKALMEANAREASVSDLVAAMKEAHGLIIATPIFKASFSGLLKVALDLLPQYGLVGKVVLPIATGGSLAHLLALDYGLRPVLQSMGARHIVQSHFVSEAELTPLGEPMDLDVPCFEGLRSALRNFRYSLTDANEAVTLGHPRPSLMTAG
jgi:FMN reductase